MEFELTPRIATFFSRYIEVQKTNILERFEKLKTEDASELEEELNDDGLIIIDFQSFKKFELEMEVDFDRNSEDMIKPWSLKLMMHFRYKVPNKDLGYVNIANIHMKVDMEEFITKINESVKTYKICPCEDNIEYKDGWCITCYPYVLTQEDRCSVCLENDGVWIELKCKHTVHKRCWNNIENNKCPLCRHQCGKYDWEYI